MANSSTMLRWARSGSLNVDENIMEGDVTENVNKFKFGDGFRRAPSSSKASKTGKDFVQPRAMRPKVSAGMLQMLSVNGGKSRFRQRPGSAMAAIGRTRPEIEEIRPEIEESVNTLPGWMASGPPLSDLTSPPTSPTAIRSPLMSSPLGSPIRASFIKRRSAAAEISLRNPTRVSRAEDRLLDFLASLPIFAHVQREKLLPLLGQLTSKHEKFGTVLLREDEETEHLTIIWNGTVTVERKMLNATLCDENRILSSCMRRPPKSKVNAVQSSGNDDYMGPASPPRDTTEPASVVIGKCGRGAVFGEFSVLFETVSNETVRVESVGGASVILVAATSLFEWLDERAVSKMRHKAREVGRWREGHANNISMSMTAAAYRYSNQVETLVPFPSQQEIRSINFRAREEVMRPLGWRHKLARQLEEEATAAELELSESLREIKRRERNRHILSIKRPASALSGSNRRHESESEHTESTLCPENVTDRKLFLATWDPPEQHRVHLGSGVRGNSSAVDGWHMQLNVDAIKDLDGMYLEKLD